MLSAETWRAIAEEGTFEVARSLEVGIGVFREAVLGEYLTLDRGSRLELSDFINYLLGEVVQLQSELNGVEWDIFRRETPEEFPDSE